MKENNVLTRREKEIIGYVSRGYTNKMIADTLFISTATVKKHLENIFQKLEVKNRVQALHKLNNHND